MPVDLPRQWDGRVREVVSARLVELGRTRRRVERLSCGHEQFYHGWNGQPVSPNSVRICRQCPGMRGAA